MNFSEKRISTYTISLLFCVASFAQKTEMVNVVKDAKQKKVNVFMGKQLFTSFIYPDSLEKPVLYPVIAADGAVVTRGYPLAPRPNEPTDHPHHVGVWFTFENVNGLDFWNNSFAIPAEKKSAYGWIKTDSILETKSGEEGLLTYHANWTNQKNDVLLEETTSFEFSGNGSQRIIDRTTTIRADVDVLFKDAKDGLLGFRVAHELQIPSKEEQKFTDDKGNVTVVKVSTDSIANGNYLTSEGMHGDSAWSTRARWCKMYGKMGKDSVSIVIIDHPSNPNYPTYWHARGYGLFSANPLGENIFTNGKLTKNLALKMGEAVIFRYRIVIHDGEKTLSTDELNALADAFAQKNSGRFK